MLLVLSGHITPGERGFGNCTNVGIIEFHSIPIPVVVNTADILGSSRGGIIHLRRIVIGVINRNIPTVTPIIGCSVAAATEQSLNFSIGIQFGDVHDFGNRRKSPSACRITELLI